jgi:hypothetical protein
MVMRNVGFDRSVAVSRSGPPSRITTAERLCCLLTLGARQAEAVLAGEPVAINLEWVAQRTGFDVATLRRLLRSRESLDSLRLSPNRLTRSQVERIPEMQADRVDLVLTGRPYYSMSDLEVASGVPLDVLGALFQVNRLEMLESAGSRPLRLTPVPGKFLLRSEAPTRDADRAWSLGLAASPCGLSAEVLLLVPRDAREIRHGHELRVAFGDRIHPVFRDDLGFERFFVPGSLEIWFRRDVDADRVRRVLGRLGARVRTAHPGSAHYNVDLVGPPADGDLLAATLARAAEAWRCPDVLFVEPEQVGIDGLGAWRAGFADAGTS